MADAATDAPEKKTKAQKRYDTAKDVADSDFTPAQKKAILDAIKAKRDSVPRENLSFSDRAKARYGDD